MATAIARPRAIGVAGRIAAQRRGRGYWTAVGRRLRRDPVTLVCGGVVLVLIVLMAVFAPCIAPADPYKGIDAAPAEAARHAGPPARHRRARPRHAVAA